MKTKKLLFALLFTAISLVNYAQTVPPVNLEPGYSVKNGHIIYPLPNTDYTTIIEVGPGKTYEELYDVPESNVTAGTLIKIYYRSEPYRIKIYLKIQATETAHFRIQGIPDENGNLPIITHENSTHNWGSDNINQWNDNLAIITINGSWGEKPSWIDLVNLHLKIFGVNQEDGDNGIWSKADHVSVKGCVFENCGNGVFFQASNNDLVDISSYNLVEGCRFTHCGVNGSYLLHNIYTQGAHSLVQFNYIEQEQDGALGSTLKDRATFSVIRYNYMEGTARTIDLVEPEEAEVATNDNPGWDNAFVYGNIITISRTNSGVPFHYGWDDNDDPYEYHRKGTLFFANNTIVMKANDNEWNVSLFDINEASTKINFVNNILLANGSGMHYFYMLRSGDNRDGGTINFTSSWVKAFAIDNNDEWQLYDTNESGDFHMNGENNLLTGNEPGFTDAGNGDYTLKQASPCRLSGTYIDSVDIEYNPISLDAIIQRADMDNPNMGCYSDNFITKIICDKTNNINLYPNPAKNNLQLVINNEQLNNKVVIYNIYGQTVKQLTINNKQLIIDISCLQDGVYFIKTGSVTKKFIVNK
jgi:hypothetical protein